MSYLHQTYHPSVEFWWEGSNKFKFVYWSGVFDTDSTFIKIIEDMK